jgi:hypothetical protein
MPGYTQSELLNALASMLKVGVTTTRGGGTLNTAQAYAQLLEMGAVTFLLNNDAVFYIGQLGVNNLYSILRQEIALVEDILIGLDEIGQIGQPITNTASLSNAKTAVLSIGAATAVSGNPETSIFDNNINAFVSQLKNNTVSQATKSIVHPSAAASSYIRTDLTSLSTLHAQLLAGIANLQHLVADFVALNLPSVAANTTIAGVQTSLTNMINQVETLGPHGSIAVSRDLLLQALASQVAIGVVAGFKNPIEVKYRSPVNPVPSTMTQLGNATGEGVAASVATDSGPWSFPIPGPLSFRLDGGPELTIGLDAYTNSFLNGQLIGPFNIGTGDHLHCIVDPNVYQSVVSAAPSTSTATMPMKPLGFKHLGCQMVFTGGSSLSLPGDSYPRIITELPQFDTLTGTSYDDATGILTSPSGGISFYMTGGYVRAGGATPSPSDTRLEIVEIISSTQIRLSNYTGVTFLTSGTLYVHAIMPSATSMTLTFSPALVGSSVGATVVIGPCVKTAGLLASPVSRTPAEICAWVTNETYPITGNPYCALNRSVVAKVSDKSPNQIALGPRSRQNTYLQVSTLFVSPNPTTAAAPTIIEASANDVLGFPAGLTLNPQYLTASCLTPDELAGAINAATGVQTAVVDNEEVTRGLLNTVPGDALYYGSHFGFGYVVSSSDHEDFALAGVRAGDLLEILTGPMSGNYTITLVVEDTLQLLMTNEFVGSEYLVPYRIQRNSVVISSPTVGIGSSVEITAVPGTFGAHASLGLYPGLTLGESTGFQAVDKLGNPFDFTSEVVPGDLLILVSGPEVYRIASVSSAQLTLKDPIPSTTEGVGFEVLSEASIQYTNLSNRLVTYTKSSSLLPLHGYDKDLSQLNNALSQVLSPGANLAPSRSQAKQYAADLLSILTATPRSPGAYTTVVPTAPDNLEAILSNYLVPPIDSVNSYIDSLHELKYNRAADLLTHADIKGFFNTTEKTASYAGAILSASQAVLNDLPNPPSTQSGVQDRSTLAATVAQVDDPTTDFSDSEGANQIEV